MLPRLLPRLLTALLAFGACKASPPASGPPDSSAASDGASSDAPAGFTPAPHVAWPQIPNHGGHELVPLRVVTVVANDEPYAADLTAFGDALVHSSWLATFGAEYGLAATGTHVVVSGAHVAPGTSFTLVQMKQYIRDAVVAATPAPTVDGKTIYVLYLPPGTVMDNNGTPDTACALVPYHTGYGTLGDGMAVLNRCPQGFESQLQMFEIVAAHEIAEAATDSNPVSNPAWELYVQAGIPPYQASLWNQEEIANSVEVGDLCIGTRVREGNFEYQREFSNAAAATGGDPCVPAIATPFFNASPDAASTGWVAVTPGAQTAVTATGWSAAPVDDWVVSIETFTYNGGTFAASIDSATSTTIDGYTYRTTNNGRTLTVHATIPAGAGSGWWGVIKLWSFHSDAHGATPAGEDFAHEGLIGLYIP